MLIPQTRTSIIQSCPRLLSDCKPDHTFTSHVTCGRRTAPHRAARPPPDDDTCCAESHDRDDTPNNSHSLYLSEGLFAPPTPTPSRRTHPHHLWAHSHNHRTASPLTLLVPCASAGAGPVALIRGRAAQAAQEGRLFGAAQKGAAGPPPQQQHTIKRSPTRRRQRRLRLPSSSRAARFRPMRAAVRSALCVRAGRQQGRGGGRGGVGRGAAGRCGRHGGRARGGGTRRASQELAAKGAPPEGRLDALWRGSACVVGGRRASSARRVSWGEGGVFVHVLRTA